MNKIKCAAELLQEVIFPRKCVVCNKALPMKSFRGIACGKVYDGLCMGCRDNIKEKYIVSPFCMKCGKQLDDENTEYCGDCKKASLSYDRGFAVFKYHDDIKQSIYRFKYKGYKVYGEFYGNEMAEAYGRILKELGAELIVPVPVHASRRRRRGYNQAEEIAKALSARIGLPVDQYCLIREKKTIPQKELSRKFRKKNLENAFKVQGNVVEYKKVILVDDIYTTGATADACAAELKRAGAEKVFCISICIGLGV